MAVTWGQGAGVGAQSVSGINSGLYLPWPQATCDRLLIFVSTNLPASGVAAVSLNGVPASARSIAAIGDLSCSIWEAPGLELPQFVNLSVGLADIADLVAYVLPVFGSQVGHGDLAFGSSDSMSHQVNGATTRWMVFAQITFPGQVFDSFDPPQQFIQSLGAFNGRPPRVFHFVTATPGEPGGPTILGSFSESGPWCATFLEVK